MNLIKSMAMALGLMAGLLANAPASAGPSETTKREIAALIAALSASNCQFQRNGSWHDSTQARAHLQRKYDYLLKKNLVDSSEQFIERAASKSSISGRAYRMRCNGQPEQDSAIWLGKQLVQLRSR